MNQRQLSRVSAAAVTIVTKRARAECDDLVLLIYRHSSVAPFTRYQHKVLYGLTRLDCQCERLPQQ